MTPEFDRFSKQAAEYAQYRPTYPDSIYQYLSTVTEENKLVWDCATGNGQAAVRLAEYYDKVIATDISEKQLANATTHEKVVYKMASAEHSGLADQSVDLITVAQAFHWFKTEEFFKEAKRVLKPKGVLAIWAYNLGHFSPEVDEVVLKLYRDILGNYWGGVREQMEVGYKGIQFPFKEIDPPTFSMRADWTLEHMIGYLSTWSALNLYIKEKGHNPLTEIAKELEEAWPSDKQLTVRWDLVFRVFVK